MNLPTPLLEILPDLLPRHLDHAGILHRGGDLHGLVELRMHGVLDQLSHHTAQGLAGSRLGDHILALDHAAEGGDGADLCADECLHFVEERGGGDG